MALTMVAVIMIGCGNTAEKKVNRLVKQDMKTTIEFPKSYEPIETTIDSAYVPWNDPVWLDMLLETSDLNEDYIKYEKVMRHAQREMTRYQNMCTSYDNTKYEEAKKNFDKCRMEVTRIETKVTVIAEKMKIMMEQQPKVIGFIITHHYHAENKEGDVMIDDKYYIINKELTKIVASYSSDDMDKIHRAINELSEFEDFEFKENMI